MTLQQLPERANLEQLKKQAKSLLTRLPYMTRNLCLRVSMALSRGLH